MKEFLSELLDYNRKANERVISQLLGQTWPDTHRLFKLMSHILAAHHIWNQRVENKAPDYAVWEELPPTFWEEQNQNNAEQSQRIWKNFSPEHLIHYTNSRGEVFENTVQDIVFHIINHSNYHRAQIATEVREQGGTPVPTDYIFFKRG